MQGRVTIVLLLVHNPGAGQLGQKHPHGARVTPAVLTIKGLFSDIT